MAAARGGTRPEESATKGERDESEAKKEREGRTIETQRIRRTRENEAGRERKRRAGPCAMRRNDEHVCQCCMAQKMPTCGRNSGNAPSADDGRRTTSVRNVKGSRTRAERHFFGTAWGWARRASGAMGARRTKGASDRPRRANFSLARVACSSRGSRRRSGWSDPFTPHPRMVGRLPGPAGLLVFPALGPPHVAAACDAEIGCSAEAGGCLWARGTRKFRAGASVAATLRCGHVREAQRATVCRERQTDCH